jgi:hypothetical protein
MGACKEHGAHQGVLKLTREIPLATAAFNAFSDRISWTSNAFNLLVDIWFLFAFPDVLRRKSTNVPDDRQKGTPSAGGGFFV